MHMTTATRSTPEAGARAPGIDERLLRQLEWTVLRRLDGLLQGDYRTLLRGAGIDLADLREYQLHDDVRHIDWNVTARLQTPYVRQFTEDREMTAWFLLDLSGSVDFGSADVTKLAVSTGFVALLARVLTRHGNRVGAMLYGTRVDTVLPPRLSRLHVLNLMQRMRTRPQAAGRWWRHLAGRSARTPPPRRCKRRSLVLVVSDFISQPGWEDALARLAQRHEVVAVRLFDPLEMALPELGLVTVEDAETGEQLFIDTSDPASASATRPRPRRAKPRCATRWRVPAPTRWSCPPTTICSNRCCALPPCGASAAA